MAWFRIDNRLVHGQVIEGWLPYLDAGMLIVVNDALAVDEVRQQIMRLAIPGRVNVRFIPVAEARKMYDNIEPLGVASLFLFSNCGDVARMAEQGVSVPVLNVGNMHYGPGKRQICAHVAATEDDLRCFDTFKKQGTQLDFRSVPSDVPLVEDW